MQFTLLTVVCLMAISGAPHLYAQQIYTWTDENGVTHLTDKAPPKNARVEDVTKYKEKTPQEQDAIERKIEKLRQSNERQDKIDAAQRAVVEAGRLRNGPKGLWRMPAKKHRRTRNTLED